MSTDSPPQQHARREAVSLVEPMSQGEALDLLQHGRFVGRVCFVHEDRPHIFPVNYIADATSLAFATAAGTKLAALRDGAPVCFEVDGSEPLDHAGWSVIVDGTAAEVTDAEEIRWLTRGPLRSWAVRGQPHWIRVTYEQVSGRWLRGS